MQGWNRSKKCWELTKILTGYRRQFLRGRRILKKIVLRKALNPRSCWTSFDGVLLNRCPGCPKRQNCHLLRSFLTRHRKQGRNSPAHDVSKMRGRKVEIACAEVVSKARDVQNGFVVVPSVSDGSQSSQSSQISVQRKLK